MSTAKPAPARTIESPAWMETFESIDREARLYPESRYCALVDRTGAAVTGSREGQWIEDRSTGAVYLWSDRQYAVGGVEMLVCRTAAQGGELTPTVIHFRILREVSIDEVRTLAAKYGGATPLPVRPGKWYEVMTD